MKESSVSGDHPLPFNDNFQEAVIGHCLTNAKFFLKCRDRLKAQWFSRNMMLGTIFSQLCRTYDQDSRFITSIDEFKNESFFLELDNEERDKYYHLINIAMLSSRNFDLDKVQRQLTGFLRVSMFKESVEGAARRYKSQGFEEAYQWTDEKIKAIRDAKFEDDQDVMSFEYPETWIIQQQNRRSNAISTGSAILDDILGGGLFKKETCAFMAPSNVGKTTAMITLARHAIFKGNHVLFMIHEGDPEEIRLRILCSFLAVTQETLFQWVLDPEKKKIIHFASEWLKRHLTFVPYIRTGAMYVDDVVTLIKKLHDEKKANIGRGYDLIINDYPKKLRSRMRSGSKEGLYRVEAAEIYDNFNHLATELDVHCFVAIQTNRSGLKQNNGKIESDHLLGMEEIDEAYGIAQNLANIITINRSPEDRQKNILRLNVTKSRNHKTDVVLNTRTKYGCYLTFGDRNMFFKDWKNDLEFGFLAGEMQENNKKELTDNIDISLINNEKGQTDANPNVGVANVNGKLESETLANPNKT